ncbi:MAG TPA: hypothetical protein VGS41_17100 [Chthonomonadales bacterium]|nr:hypothetical protein [Chthonomonadales bacterium]
MQKLLRQTDADLCGSTHLASFFLRTSYHYAATYAVQFNITAPTLRPGVVGYWLMNGFTKLLNGLFSPSNPGSPIWQMPGAH